MRSTSTADVCITWATLACAAMPALGATVTVTDTSGGTGGPDCTLRDALTAANTDAATGGCPAGSGADSIDLPADAVIELTAVDNSIESGNGLPSITSQITINGNGSTIERDPAAPEFRIFHVSDTGDLTLNELTVRNGLFQTVSASGAGITNHGVLTLTSSAVLDNMATSGGGMTNLGGTVTLTNSTVSRNTAGGASGSGGGIWNTLAGVLTMIDSTVSDNSAGGGGGGISNVAELTLTNSTVSDNVAGAGGGGISNFAKLTLTNSTVSGNTAANAGGGLSSNVAGSVTLTHTTFSGNSSGMFGGGVVNLSGSVTLSNSLIAANTSGFGGPDYDGNGLSTGYNLIGDGTDAVGFGAPGDQVGTAGSPIDPMLDPLADNGGPTLTHALQSGSPAIDTGDCAGGTITTDQRGEARPQGSACDIGSYEATPGAPMPDISIDDVSTSESAGALTFTVSLSAISSEAVLVDFTTADGTATIADPDYVAVSGTLTIAAGRSQQTIEVPLIDDAVVEDDETFSVLLTNPVNGVIVDGEGLGTILDDDGVIAPPVASCQDVTANVDATCEAAVTPAMVDDGSTVDSTNCGTPMLSLDPPGPYAPGSTEVTLTVTDDCAQSDTCTAVITVVDNTSPTIDCSGIDPTRSADPGQCSFTMPGVGFDPATSDNCPGALLTNDFNGGSTLAGESFVVGATSVTWIVTDAAGNSDSCTVNIIITDDENPAITCPADVEAEAVSPEGATVSYDPATADDNCPGVSVGCDPPSGGLFAIGTTSVTCRATDSTGNEATCGFDVTVLSPEEIVRNLMDVVKSLRDSDALNGGQANALLKKLSGILRKLAGGQIHVACNRLGAFINQVTALIQGGAALTEEEGRPLIDSATNARAALGCGPAGAGSTIKKRRSSRAG